jgi:hypothetical protein
MTRGNGDVADVANETGARVSRRRFIGGVGAGMAALAAGGVPIATAQVATATLAPGEVTVFPAHGTRTASPATEISFRGVSAVELGEVTVIGSQSGSHFGVLMPHAGDAGVSFVPDAPFWPGERVTVQTVIPLRATPRGSITFEVAVPAAPVATPVTGEVDLPASPPREFRSRLDLLPPAIEVTTPGAGADEGLIFLGAKIENGQNGAMILDNEGELVWFAPLASEVAVSNDVRVQEYNGEPVLTMWEGIAKQGTGFGHLVLRNQAYETIATVQAGNGYPGADQHECLLTPEGTALMVIYNPLKWDLSNDGGAVNGPVLDGVVQEVEIATGRVIFEWHSLDHVALDEAYGEPSATPDEPWDYFHLNSIEPTDDGNFILSARHTHAIYKIERRTGRVLWRLNGKRSDFALGEGVEFAYQHDARLHTNGDLTLFDNASSDQADAGDVQSRGLVLALDEEAKQATLVRQYVHPTAVLSVSQGNMQVLPNGNVFVGWGSAPVFSEFDPDGELVFNGRLPTGGTSYRAYRCPWAGMPIEPPALAAEPGLGSELTVYASWNGATEVATWEVVAGPGPGDLAPVGSGARTGFETAITVETAGTFVAVQALDGDGAIIGASEPIEVGST